MSEKIYKKLEYFSSIEEVVDFFNAMKDTELIKKYSEALSVICHDSEYDKRFDKENYTQRLPNKVGGEYIIIHPHKQIKIKSIHHPEYKLEYQIQKTNGELKISYKNDEGRICNRDLCQSVAGKSLEDISKALKAAEHDIMVELGKEKKVFMKGEENGD